jgi:hypothetical protein
MVLGGGGSGLEANCLTRSFLGFDRVGRLQVSQGPTEKIPG